MNKNRNESAAMWEFKLRIKKNGADKIIQLIHILSSTCSSVSASKGHWEEEAQKSLQSILNQAEVRKEKP